MEQARNAYIARWATLISSGQATFKEVDALMHDPVVQECEPEEREDTFELSESLKRVFPLLCHEDRLVLLDIAENDRYEDLGVTDFLANPLIYDLIKRDAITYDQVDDFAEYIDNDQDAVAVVDVLKSAGFDWKLGTIMAVKEFVQTHFRDRSPPEIETDTDEPPCKRTKTDDE